MVEHCQGKGLVARGSSVTESSSRTSPGLINPGLIHDELSKDPSLFFVKVHRRIQTTACEQKMEEA